MNINKYKPTEEFFNNLVNQTAKNKNNFKAVKPAEANPESRASHASGLIEGSGRMNPIEQYSYFDARGKTVAQTKLEAIPGNPQKTIARANRVINRAIMPPAVGNPERQQLPDAIRLKRSAESRLDKAA